MNRKRVILALLIVITIISSSIVRVFAATQSEIDAMENKGQEIENKINQTQDDLDEIEKEISENIKKIKQLTGEISEYENQIEKLDEEIAKLEANIKEVEKKLKETEKKFNKQEQMLQGRLVALYEAGETTFLDVLVTSSGIADFISNYYLVSEIATYDTQLLEEMEKNRQEIKVAKEKLEDSKKDVEKIKASKERTMASLENSQAVKEQYGEQLTEEEKKKQKELDQFEKDKKEVEQRLRDMKTPSDYPIYIPGNPNESGYIFPVAGLGMGNINRQYYPSYPGHTGADVNINVAGKSIVAVKDGTVVISEAQRWADGSYRSYGEYVVIDHNDGTKTLYAHGLPNSRRVKVGETVKQGQVLMTVGTTGNSTGLHLHFEVRVNGSPVNPLPYLR